MLCRSSGAKSPPAQIYYGVERSVADLQCFVGKLLRTPYCRDIGLYEMNHCSIIELLERLYGLLASFDIAAVYHETPRP